MRGRLLDLGRKSLETGKPVLIWKAGTTDAGVKAAASHTANMTGSYDLYRAAMRQCGLIEVDDVEPIVDLAKLFGQGRLPKGNSVGVLSISGGSGVVFADAAVRGGLTLPPFSPQTLAKTARADPGFRLAGEPGRHHRRLFNDKTLFARTLDVVLEDPGLDQLSSCIASISGPSAPHSCEVIAAAAAKTEKPVSVALVGPARQVRESRQDAGGGQRAVRHHAGAACARRPRCWRALPPTAGACCRARRRARPKPAGVVLPAGAVTLNEAESKAVLRAFGVPGGERGVRGRPAATWTAATGASRRRSRSRSCRATCRTRRRPAASSSAWRGRRCAEAATAVSDNARKPCPAPRSTACWCRRWPQGLETLIGVINDPSFGPVVALGLGGVLTEVLKDVTYRVAPFDLETAREMIAELRGGQAVRGLPRQAGRPTRRRWRRRWWPCRAWPWPWRRASRSSTSTRCSCAPPARAWPPPTPSSS